MDNDEIYNLISKKIPKENIVINESMKRYTSFKIGGNADFLVKVKSIEEIKYIIEICNQNKIQLTIIGNGSNILVKDSGIRGIVLKIEIQNIKFEDIVLNNVQNNKLDESVLNNVQNNKSDESVLNNVQNNKLDESVLNNIQNNKLDESVLNSIQNNKLNENIFGNIENNSGLRNVFGDEKNQLEENDKINNKYCIVTIGAGEKLGMLAQKFARKGLTGFEFASGIPGTVGGAVRMNAGAYGSEFSNIVVESTVIDLKGNISKLSNSEHCFGYRNSIFKYKEYIVLETKIILKYVENANEIIEKMNEYKKSRLEKQPIEFPSAGSTFKRGDNFITAKLIDECGLKGYKVGDAQVSEKHAGFIINTGNATAKDVLELVEIVKKRVYEKFNCNIELELEIIGE